MKNFIDVTDELVKSLPLTPDQVEVVRKQIYETFKTHFLLYLKEGLKALCEDIQERCDNTIAEMDKL